MWHYEEKNKEIKIVSISHVSQQVHEHLKIAKCLLQ